MDVLKWVIFAIVGFLAFNWLRNGIAASATLQTQLQPSAWGSGMVYAPGSAWQGAYGFAPPPQYFQPVPMVSASYDNGNGFGIDFNYGG